MVRIGESNKGGTRNRRHVAHISVCTERECTGLLFGKSLLQGFKACIPFSLFLPKCFHFQSTTTDFFAHRSAIECVINGDSREDRAISVTANTGHPDNRIQSCHQDSKRPNADVNLERLKHRGRRGTALGQIRTEPAATNKISFHVKKFLKVKRKKENVGQIFPALQGQKTEQFRS